MERLQEYTNNILFKLSFEYTIAKLIVCLILGMFQIKDAILAIMDLCSWSTKECYAIFTYIGFDIFTMAVVITIIVDIAAREFYSYVKDRKIVQKGYKDINTV